MDHHHKKKNNPILSPFSQIYCSKKAIKILLTLSLFSILFSYSSLFSSLFSTLSTKLFSCYYYYSTDRNYIFLLCNGILILIFKNSGLFANAPSGTDNYAKKNVQSHQSTGFREYNVKKNAQSNQYASVSNVSSSSQINAEEITKAAVEVDKAERAIISFTDEVGENVTLIAHNEEKEKQVVVELLNFVEEEEEEHVNTEEEEEEEVIELLSREELNKKCEEFIRKMKCGIKLEA